jgi:streptogramin lyase
VSSAADDALYMYRAVDQSLAKEFTVDFPQSVAFGKNGIVYVGSSSVIYAIDPESGFMTSLGESFLSGYIYGITYGPDNYLYATGSGMQHVQQVSLQGANTYSMSVPDASNHRSTAFDPEGNIYLTSFTGEPISYWSPELCYAGTISGGGLAYPFGIDVASNGDIYVASQNNGAYYVFGNDGSFKRSQAIDCAGQVRGITLDPFDDLWVCCYEDDVVIRFNASDEEVERIPVNTPTGITYIDRAMDWD